MLKLGWLKHFVLLALLIVEKADSNAYNNTFCKSMLKHAASLAATCCQLTRPSLDEGNKDCRKSLNLPKRANWTTIEQYIINACIEECNFIGVGYADADPPFRLDLKNIENNLRQIFATRKDSEKVINFLLQAYKSCEAFRNQHLMHFVLHLPTVEFLEEPCNPYALQMTTCVRIYAMQHCPKEYFTQTPACLRARNYFVNCVFPIPK